MSHDTAMDLGSPLQGVLQLGISYKNSLGVSGMETARGIQLLLGLGIWNSSLRPWSLSGRVDEERVLPA